MSRILRTFVCLLLICCILVNLSPLKAQATGAGAVAGGIVKAASVSIPGLWPIVACLAVVGITAYGIESGTFENIANSCYSAFESAGTWINNGMAEIFRTEDADGNVQYYVDGGMLEAVRSWALSSSTVTEAMNYTATVGGGSYPLFWSEIPFCMVTFTCTERDTYFVGTFTTQPGTIYNGYEYGQKYSSTTIGANSYGCPCNGYYFRVSYGSGSIPGYAADYLYLGNFSYEQLSRYAYGNTSWSGAPRYIAYHVGLSFKCVDDLSLGYFPSAEIDEDTVVTFHPYLAEVIRTRTGGSGGSGEDENKWWLAVAYAETLEKLYQTSQQAQIENPSVTEIPDIQVGIEYDVTEEEDEEGKKQYYLDPIQTPGTGTDPGTGDGTDTGTDTDPDTGTDSGNGSGNTGTDSGSTGNTGSSWKPPSDHSQFALADLSKFFPFCIPFDLFDFFKLLNADPVAPSFTWEIQDLSGQTYGLTVDLSQWDSVAQLFRRLQLFLFVCGLAAASRKYIKW